MTTSSRRVARQFVARANRQMLQDAMSTLADLGILADNVEEITDTYGLHYKMAASSVDTEVASQIDALVKIQEGIAQAKKVETALNEMLRLFPDDKSAQRAAKDTGIMLRRLRKVQLTAHKMVKSLAKKQLPPELKKQATKIKRGIVSKLENPKALEVLPWAEKTFRYTPSGGVKGLEYRMIFRLEDPTIPNHDHKVRMVLSAHTVSDKGLMQSGSNLYEEQYKDSKSFVEHFLGLLTGWPGLKGEGKKNEGRLAIANRIAPIVRSMTRRWSAYGTEEVEISKDGLSVEGNWRSEALERLSEWEEETTYTNTQKNAEADFRKSLGQLEKHVKQVDISYAEKGWWYIRVIMK